MIEYKDYIYLGLFIALGILSKYLFLYLLIGILLLFLFFIKKKKIRVINCFITSSIVLIILLPHIIWLTENNYTTILYGLQRTGGQGSFY